MPPCATIIPTSQLQSCGSEVWKQIVPPRGMNFSFQISVLKVRPRGTLKTVEPVEKATHSILVEFLNVEDQL